MTVTCYYCNISIPENQAKRCSRCRLVIYCSKECQTLSWKASHKVNCVPNPTIAALNGTKPKKFSPEWEELEVDKQLSRWMAEWRQCFTHWTMLALDLANHPPDRVITHCLHMVVEPRDLQAKIHQRYRIVDAEVVTYAHILDIYPELTTDIDPTDFTRFRYVVALRDAEGGEVCRARLFQWNVRSLGFWNQLPNSAELAEGSIQVLMYSVEHMTPAAVEGKLRLGV